LTCWVTIPVKPPGEAKSRLAERLTLEQRMALSAAMLQRVVAAVQAADHVDALALVGPTRLGVDERVQLIADPGLGLNAALDAARGHVLAAGASRMIVLFADLPQVTVHDVRLLAAAPAGELAIAPDRHGTGTNALSLPLPAARGFTFAFGPDSFAQHKAEAERLGLPLDEIRSPGLARDVDVPEDLADAAALIDPG
jgi:2-phospho-L-lactate/phosphoenolpyruvate guanylyltransferase